MFSLIFIFLVVHWPFTTSISGGFRASSQPTSTGIVLIDNGWDLTHPPFCAGALISSQIVLTNGLCCSEPPLNRTRIYLGSTTPFSSGQFFFIVDYRLIGMAVSANYKLCVLRLDRAVLFSESVQPLKLPSAADNFVQGTQLLYTYGFGSVDLDKQAGLHNPNFKRVLSSHMMAIFFPRLENEVCEKFFGAQTLGDWKLLCMGFTMERKKRLMLDDNGAPLVGMYDRVVYGISSTYSKLISAHWDTVSFPNYVIDVKSARDDITRAIRQMFE